MIRPTVSQSIRSSRLTALLSVAGHQPRDQALEVARELRVRSSERDRLCPRPVLRADQPPAPAMDLQPPSPEIQVPPDRVLRPRVLARRRRVPALRADQPPAGKRHLNDHPIGLEPNLLHQHPLPEAQKPGKCRRDAHAVPPCKPLTSDSQQPAGEGGGRVAHQCATSENFLRQRNVCSDAESGSHRVHIDAGRPQNQRRSTGAHAITPPESARDPFNLREQ